MALYETGSATDTDDLIDKLMDFATVTNTGFSEDDRDLVNNEASLNDGGSLSVQFEWDSDTIGIHQALSYSSPTPGGGTNDSGSGGITATQRACHFPSGETGSYTYHFFTDHATAGTYVHVVVEYSSGLFRHFGFGNLSKIGDWTGGEYAYGHFWDQTAADIDNPLDANHACPFDSVGGTISAGDRDLYPTMHVEGLPDQAGSGKWGVMWADDAPGTDGDGNARVNLLGGMRDGPIMNGLGGLSTNPVNGQILLVPLGVFYRNTTPTPDELTLLGFAPDMAYVNMKNLTPGALYTVGSAKYRTFPLVRKQYLKDNTEESWNAGIAYRDYTS